MKLWLIILLPTLVFSEVTVGQNSKKLDELLIKSGKIRQHGVQGFVFKSKSMSIAIPIDTTNVKASAKSAPTQITGEKSIETTSAIVAAPALVKHVWPTVMGQYVPYSQYVDDVEKRDQQISDLNSQITKLTIVVENNVEHASKMSVIFDTLTKICESIGALIAVISALAAFFKFKKKKNG
jgi:hypothetical protein